MYRFHSNILKLKKKKKKNFDYQESRCICIRRKNYFPVFEQTQTQLYLMEKEK